MSAQAQEIIQYKKLKDKETYTLSLEELIKRLDTNLETGLSEEEAKRRLQFFGPNVIPKVKPSLFKVYIAPLLNWLINIYLIISTILALFAIFVLPNIWGQVIEWLAIIAINSILAIVQQARAQSKLEALEKLSAPQSKVIREGKMEVIPADQLVPGDIIKLEQGDRVPADARIIKASSLRVNEAPLTGESVEVDKLQEGIPIDVDTPLSSRRNMVYLGTYVTAGSAMALVVETGQDTEIGVISKNLEELNTGEIPLRQKVNRLAKYLGLAVLVYLSISITYNIYNIVKRGELYVNGELNIKLLSQEIVRALITAMSIMPINIPLLTTIILITGVLAMAKHNVIIRDLNAVESLGRVSVVCSDKTGTITKNEMTAKWIWLPKSEIDDELYGVTGVGFDVEGKILSVDKVECTPEIIKKEPQDLAEKETIVLSDSALEALLISGLLNNDSLVTQEIEKEGGKKRVVFKAIGDITDASILILFYKSGLDPNVYKEKYQLVLDLPFDSILKRMSKVYMTREGKYVSFTKGATEVLLPKCTKIMRGKRDSIATLSDKERERIRKKADMFASEGFRVISFAIKYLDVLPERKEDIREIIESDMIYLGFVAIIDPPREGVRSSVEEARGAGIKPIMITGDSLATAKSIARQVGIYKENDLAIEGAKIESLDDKQFLRTSVFARVSPDHKKLIVNRYQKRDKVVAMTGDGVNDSLAVSMADVGIAMGITGTDVTKQAADMVIADDSFNSIVVGIREGRGLFQKIRAIIFFYIAVNVAEALIYFGASMIPGFYLLNTWQQIYIFMTAHSLPPFAIIIDNLGKDVMKEKPRDSEGIFNKPLTIMLLLYSITSGLTLYFAYFATLYGIIPLYSFNMTGYAPNLRTIENLLNPVSWEQAKARTMLHTVAFISETFLVISLRRLNKPIHRILREEPFWLSWPLIFSVIAVHTVLMYVPELQLTLVDTIGINLEIIKLYWVDWAIAIGLGLLPIFLIELYKVWLLRQGKFI